MIVSGLKNLKVKTKVYLLAFALLLVAIIMGTISITNLVRNSNAKIKDIDTQIRTSYDLNIKNQVENVISLLNAIEAKRASGEYTLEEAQKLAADQVRELKYGETGYFWIDTFEGVNVVLLGKDTEGTNRYEMQM